MAEVLGNLETINANTRASATQAEIEIVKHDYATKLCAKCEQAVRISLSSCGYCGGREFK